MSAGPLELGGAIAQGMLEADGFTLVKFIATGAVVSIRLTLIISLLAMVIATAVGLGRLARNAPLRWALTVYVEFFRSTSMFVQIFWAYYVLPLTGLDLSAYQAAILVMSLNAGAYGSEIVRAAVQSVPREQREACTALNLSSWQAMRHVLYPQAMVAMIPSLGNLALEILNGTAMVSAVAIADLTFQAEAVRVQTGNAILPYVTICVLYFFLATCLTWCFKFLEGHFGRGHEGTAGVARGHA